jgi:hypothetical protein
MKRLLLGSALASVLSATAFAAATSKTDPSVIILNPPAGLASAINWQPSLGDSVTFTVTYPKQLDHYGVRIQVLCYQDGNLVFGMAGPYDYAFLLGGSMSQWYLNGGAASCHADLYYWSYSGGQKFNELAWTDFEAAARK